MNKLISRESLLGLLIGGLVLSFSPAKAEEVWDSEIEEKR